MNRFVFLLSVVFLSGCVTIPDQQVVKREYSPIAAKEFGASDKNIIVEYSPVSFGTRKWYTINNSIPIVVKNKSNSAIKIIWNESVLVLPNGSSERIINSGVRLIDRDKPIADSVIAPSSQISDSIVPISKIQWNGGSWEYLPLCGVLVTEGGRLVEKDEDCLDKEFRLLLTYEIGGKKRSLDMKYKMSKREEYDVPYKK